MQTEKVLNRLQNQVDEPGEHVVLKKADAKLVLERVNHLEGVAAALLRSQHAGDTSEASKVVLPYRNAP